MWRESLLALEKIQQGVDKRFFASFRIWAGFPTIHNFLSLCFFILLMVKVLFLDQAIPNSLHF